MHRNYFTFERQVAELRPQLQDCLLQKCFTYRKDELILHLSGREDRFLRIGLDLQKPYLLLSAAPHIKDPLTTFFPALEGKRLCDSYILPYDKRIVIDFGGFGLQAIFYGKHPNVILHDAAGHFAGSFKKQTGDTAGDRAVPLLLPRELTAEELSRALAEGRHMTAGRFFAYALAGFNKQLASELCHRCGLPPDIPVDKLDQDRQDRIFRETGLLLAEFETGTPALYHEQTGNLVLSICNLTHIKDIARIEPFQNLNDAWDRYIYLSGIVQRYERQYHRAVNTVAKRIGYLERTCRQLYQARDLAERKAEAHLKGKLLQAFAHEIQKGETKVSLPNIFNSGSAMVEIKLNPAKTVHENARIYFEKFKDRSERDDQLQIKIATLEQEISEMQKLSARLAEKPARSKLDAIITDLENRHLIQPESDSRKSDTAFIYSFNRLLLEKKWEILIGKSAANNDLLTFKFSRKFDLWFHAQSVPGSHVVIRLPNRNEHPPQSVIQDAASIAAYHSTARHSGMVPVNYTEVRYVRKPRKAPPGQVLISNEKTLFVKPKKLA